MAEETENQGNPTRILLVDDEAGFVDVMAKRLRKRGFEITTAYNGSDALKLLRRSDFDIALLDLKMEGLDGLEVLKIIKVMAPELPVIILTGHGCLSSAEEGIKMGAADYISKPHDFEALVEKIRFFSKKE